MLLQGEEQAPHLGEPLGVDRLNDFGRAESGRLEVHLHPLGFGQRFGVELFAGRGRWKPDDAEHEERLREEAVTMDGPHVPNPTVRRCAEACARAR